MTRSLIDPDAELKKELHTQGINDSSHDQCDYFLRSPYYHQKRAKESLHCVADMPTDSQHEVRVGACPTLGEIRCSPVDFRWRDDHATA